MARRRKHRRPRTHKRRKMGALGGIDFKTPLLAGVGGVGMTYLINGPMATTSWINMAAIAGGLLLPKFIKNPAAVGLGAGIFTAGAISMLQNSGTISGMHKRRMMGRVILGPGGKGPISAIAGVSPGVQARQIQSELGRRQAAGTGRVIVGAHGPISSLSGIHFDDSDL